MSTYQVMSPEMREYVCAATRTAMEHHGMDGVQVKFIREGGSDNYFWTFEPKVHRCDFRVEVTYKVTLSPFNIKGDDVEEPPQEYNVRYIARPRLLLVELQVYPGVMVAGEVEYEAVINDGDKDEDTVHLIYQHVGTVGVDDVSIIENNIDAAMASAVEHIALVMNSFIGYPV